MTQRSRLRDLPRHRQKRVSSKRQRLCFCSCKSTRVDWLVAENFETTEGLRTDSPAGNVDSHNSVCSLCSFTHAMSRMHTFKDKKLIESCCIVFQLKVAQKKELQAERFCPHVFPSAVQRMQDEDCGFDCRTRATSSNFHRVKLC